MQRLDAIGLSNMQQDFKGAKQDNGESVSVNPANFVEEDGVLHHQRNFLPTATTLQTRNPTQMSLTNTLKSQFENLKNILSN
jgi:hypothetical protein